MSEHKVDTELKNKHWNFNKFLTGFIKNVFSPRTWAWGFASGVLLFAVCAVLKAQSDPQWLRTLIVCWTVITVFFIGGKCLQDAYVYMIKNRANMNINLGR